ncbi:MAG: HpcH/HpaI aldolase/citrate lyase family protein [Bdellovibrionota bacterium]
MKSTLKTMIFVPAYIQKYLSKAADLNADAIIFDLEDSVPEKDKLAARENIKSALETVNFKQRIFVRVNPRDSGLFEHDIDAILHPQLEGLMLTKSFDEKDILFFDELVKNKEQEKGLEVGSTKFCPLIETSRAVMRAYEIATASERIVGLAFGGEDYLTNLDGLHKKHGHSLLVPRSLIVIAARAAGVDVLDTPYLDVHDLNGLQKEAELARELGFSGILALHPKQLETITRVFSPSAEEIRHSQAIIESIRESEKSGLGVAVYDGALIGPPMHKRALKILAKAEKEEFV